MGTCLSPKRCILFTCGGISESRIMAVDVIFMCKHQRGVPSTACSVRNKGVSGCLSAASFCSPLLPRLLCLSFEGERSMPEQDFMPIQNFDYLEFYVGNAKQSAYYFSHAWGFTSIAYAVLETGMRDRSSYVLEQGNVRIVVTSPLGPAGEMPEHIKLHGDGVKSIALRVDDAERAYREATSRGARGVWEAAARKDDYGMVKTSAIAG